MVTNIDKGSETMEKVSKVSNSETPEDSVVELANGRYKVTEHTDTGTLVYEVEKTPWQIVEDTPDITTNTDPGLVGLIPKNIREIDREGVNAINLLKKVQSGYLFKVKSYDESGNMTYRYYHSWTSVSGMKNTMIPTLTNPKLNPEYNKRVVDYYADTHLDYGKVTTPGIGTEANGNVAAITWFESEPTKPPEDDSDISYDPVPAVSGPIISSSDYHDTDLNSRIWLDLPGEPIWRKNTENIFSNEFLIGTKPMIREEVIETRRTRYVANPDLDVDERVLDEGADKIKVTTTIYTLNRNSGPRSEVEGFNIGETSNVKYPNVPTVENGGVTRSETVTYTDARDKVVEKRVPRATVVDTPIQPTKRYEADPSRARGEKDITTPGTPGNTRTVITYTVNPNTGQVTEQVGQPTVTKQPTDTVIKVATQDKVAKSHPVERTTRVNKDHTKPLGYKHVDTEGFDGYTETITHYDVDPTTGTVTERIETRVVPSVERVVTEGALAYDLPTTGTADMAITLAGLAGTLVITKRKKTSK